MEAGVSIIDLTQTATQLEEAKKVIAQTAKDGKKILVVATKKVASTYARELAQASGIPFITTKWLPGLLTNFETIIKNVKKMKSKQSLMITQQTTSSIQIQIQIQISSVKNANDVQNYISLTIAE